MEDEDRFNEGRSRGRFDPPGAEAALVFLSMLILVLPAFTPDGPEARVVSVTRDVKPLVIEVESAAWYEWALLDGIGEARARRIVDYVSGHLPLKSVEQLAEIPGLPRGWLTKARPFITLRREEAGR